MKFYNTFLRTAKSFEELASAEKVPMGYSLTHAEAYEVCQDFNNNRSMRDEDAGTKMEFEFSHEDDSIG